MRLEVFSAYKYSIRKLSEDSDNAYVMEVPLADYEDTYVDIIFTREDKTINMKVPHIISKAGDEIDVKGNTFSINGVKFGENIKLADGSTYILKYGIIHLLGA